MVFASYGWAINDVSTKWLAVFWSFVYSNYSGDTENCIENWMYVKFEFASLVDNDDDVRQSSI